MSVRPRPWRRALLLVFALLAFATAPPVDAAGGVLTPGEPVQPVYVFLVEPHYGEPPLGCVGPVQLTVKARGTSFGFLAASLDSGGCDVDLCAPFVSTGLLECRQRESLLGFYGTSIPGGGVDLPFVEVACLRNATLHLDADGDGEPDLPELLTVTPGPC